MFSFKKMLDGKSRPLVMGILNVTPDSFSDGGEAFTIEKAVKKLNILCEQGADIIDVGACSTAPNNVVVSEQEELRRLENFLPEIVKSSNVPVSIDTFRPSVAEFALKNGVSIVNDESGIYNICMAKVVADYGAGWIFMHTGGGSSDKELCYPNGVCEDVMSFFGEMKTHAINDGISEEQLCYDCGIGFGKTRQNDIELLADCERLLEYSPLLVGVSRKRVIGEIIGEERPCERIAGSVAAATIMALKGVGVLRVHDVKETMDALKIASAIKRGVV